MDKLSSDDWSLRPMAVVIVLFASWLVFRGAGILGVSVVAGWRDSLRFALTAMFLFTVGAHFTSIKHDMARMVPAKFPRPMLIIYATGVLEFLGAVGLTLPRLHRVAAFCLIALLIAMFPANVKAAREGLSVRGQKMPGLWVRTPIQILFIALLWCTTT
jgi:uncharacterized membrane protein